MKVMSDGKRPREEQATVRTVSAFGSISLLDKMVQRARTLAIVQELSRGKHLCFRDGSRIGMTEDMTIGFVYNSGISKLSEMTLSQLNTLLNREGIGFPIPDVK